jgi:hypothetical protein
MEKSVSEELSIRPLGARRWDGFAARRRISNGFMTAVASIESLVAG